MSVLIQETYSSPLVNYVEPHKINGVEYTKFYTKINTDINVGDYVYILNGNYDNTDLINQFEYQKGTTGYRVLNIDKTSITLDILYKNEDPYNSDSFEDYTKVYLVDSLNKFNYENIDNGFGFDLLTGEKYSTKNNNIFLSQIENMPYTEETQTMDKFFKSFSFDGHQLQLANTKGQTFNDSSTLNFELEEKSFYSTVGGSTGSTSFRTSSGNNYFFDFDFIKSVTNVDKLVALIGDTQGNLGSRIWSLDKFNMSVNEDLVYDSNGSEIVVSRLIRSFETEGDTIFPNKNIMEVSLPSNLSGNYLQQSSSGLISLVASPGSNISYTIVGLGETVILGYEPQEEAIFNYRSFGFYNTIVQPMIPNPDNQRNLGSVGVTQPYNDGTNTTPYFVLSTRNGDLGTFSGDFYFPVNNDNTRVNVVPSYAEFSGIGSPTRVEVADYINDGDGSNNFEICFAGEQFSEVVDPHYGGMYFYSYTGNYLNLDDGNNYIGNSIELSKTSYDKWKSGIWAQSLYNPFSSISIDESMSILNSEKDIKWIGIERKELGLNLTISTNGSVISNGSGGIWYSKYLLTTSLGSYYIYLNFNGDLLRNNTTFNDEVTNLRIPQVHCVIERISNNSGNLIGGNKTNSEDVFPYILDGEFTISQVGEPGITKFTINESFDDINFSTYSVSNFDYNNQRWIVSSSAKTPRVRNSNGSGGSGFYFYDRSVGYFINEFNITSTYSIELGDSLLNDSVIKSKGEVLDGVRRIWSITSEGLHLFEYELEYNTNYYYTIDFDNNEIPLDNNLYKNDRVYIMEDFMYDGISYNKGDICKWNKNTKRWEIDYTYYESYLSKAHFKDGKFSLDSTFNDGIFGDEKTISNWIGGEWRNGIFYNSVWQNGIMKSKSDSLVSQSYYSSLINSSVNLTTDFSNNGGYGYNFILNSTIQSSDIINANIIESIVGIESDNKLLESEYKSLTFSFTDIDITKSRIIKSNVYDTQVNNSRIENSNLDSSKVGGQSSIVNTGGKDNIIDNAIIENKGRINIISYDKWYNIKNDILGSDIIHIHKFFIDENSFKELDFEDEIIINNGKINSENPTSLLDNIFYVLGGTGGYYSEVYKDLNSIVKNSTQVEYQEKDFKVFVSKRLRTQNVNKSVISFNGSNLVVSNVVNNNPQYSIDISIVADKILFGSDESIYRNSIIDDSSLKFRVIDISNSSIQVSHFKNSWIRGGEWINGSIINPDQLSNKYQYGTIQTYDNNGTMSISMELSDYLQEFDFNDLTDNNDILYLDNLYDPSFNDEINGGFKIVGTTVSSFTSSATNVILEPYTTISLTSSVSLTQPLSLYSYLNYNRIDGATNSLVIKGGFFKNQSFRNLTFNNSNFNLNNISFNNIRNLSIIGSEITNNSNVVINNGFFAHGQISNDFSSNRVISNLVAYKQLFNYSIINSGYITRSVILNSTFNNGIYDKNNYQNNSDLIPINTNVYNSDNTALLPIWYSGQFNGGTFSNSIWLSGTFSNGRMFNSEFLGGSFENGIFGNLSSRTTLNLFRKGIWKNGTFENGIFGDNSNRTPSINPIYATTSYIPSSVGFGTLSPYYQNSGTNIWENGNFNNGILSSMDDGVTIWYDGKFNNGQILDSVIWYDGIFNSGKFKSTYGRYTSTVQGELNLLSISSTYSNTGVRVVEYLDHYTSSFGFLDSYNISSIRSIEGDNVFDNPGTLVLDKSDNQLKYMFISKTSSISSPFAVTSSGHGYSEKEISDFYDSPSSMYVQFNNINENSDIESQRNPLYNSNTIGSKIYVQDTSNEYVYYNDEYILSTTFLGSTISGTSLTFSNLYAWRNGVFNNGEFGDPNNIDNSNPSWLNGTFNGGKYYGKLWKNGTFVSGNFNGVGSSQSQTSLTNIFEGYDPQSTMDKYINDVSNLNIATVSVNQVGYKNVYDNYNWFGIWLDGKVTSNINELTDSSDRVNENTLIQYFREDKYNRKRSVSSNFNNMIWVSGDFDSSDANFNSSVWLSGTFSNGNFSESMFNPYVMRWDYESEDLSNIKFKFEMDSKKCVWENGTFKSGVFYISDWNNGRFEYGTMVGGQFKGGISDYMSAFSTIWVDGRFRNGNWYGSNFTLSNLYGIDSVPNPFSYLSDYFDGASTPPFMTDILSNNSLRLSDDRLHLWNSLEGTQGSSTYSVVSNDFGVDSDSLSIPTLGFPSPPNFNVTHRLEDVSTFASGSDGRVLLEFEIDNLSESDYPSGLNHNFNLSLVDTERFSKGVYNIKFYNNSNIDQKWVTSARILSNTFTLLADVYTNGVLTESNKVLKTITNTTNPSIQDYQMVVNSNQEYNLKVNYTGVVNGIDFTSIYVLEFDLSENDVNYKSNNNTLSAYIEPNFEGGYLNSTISTTSSFIEYSNSIGVTQSLYYEYNDYATISIPSDILISNGAYTQFGNGAIQKGIWENGVWNNGYRGIEFGVNLNDGTLNTSTSNFTFANGMSASVYLNPLYPNNSRYQYKTEPIIYFNRVQRSFKISKDTWRFVLESAFSINGTETNDDYNRLNLGDNVTIGNIIGIDINGDRKLIKDVFTVVDLPTSNRVTLEYRETFPLDDISIDSDRHLIYVHKNIWLSGAFLNGYFEGVMNNGFVKGNRNITLVEDSHLIDVRWEGGKLSGSKYSLVSAFDNKTTEALSLSPQFSEKYNNLYHSTVIQNMNFDDDVTLITFSMINPRSLQVFGSASINEKSFTFSSTANDTAVQYIYNSDIDVVYEPEYYTSLYDQTIFNSSVLNQSVIDDGKSTKIFNIPAGYITYDVLSSVSKFKYSLSPDQVVQSDFELNLGSKYKIFNTIYEADFSKSPDNGFDTDIPSTFNIVQSSQYGLLNNEFSNGITGNNGITFGLTNSIAIHEDFMYMFATNSYSLVSGDNSFRTRGRYHMVEVEAEFFDGKQIVNPYNTADTITLNTTYSYSSDQLPKLTIGQGYNELYEYNNGVDGYLSPYDNDFIRFFNGNSLSEINSFTTSNTRLTMKSFMYNNFGGYRDSVKLFEKGFDFESGNTSSTTTVNSPGYYNFKHYELDQIPFYRYQDFIDPITGSVSDWNASTLNTTTQDQTRRLDDNIKVPYYATSVPIDYSNDDFVLSDNINLFGGTNVDTTNIVDLEVFRALNSSNSQRLNTLSIIGSTNSTSNDNETI